MVSSGVQVLGTTFSPFVNRVRIALNLKSVDFKFIEENLSSKSDLLLKSNPVYKKIHVLIHDGKCICESLIIVQYIDEGWNGDGDSILPSDPYDRAIARFWTSYFDDKVVSSMMKLGSVQEDEKAALIMLIKQGMGLLEEVFVQFSKGKSYFGGDNIGYIDIVLGSWVTCMKAMETMSGIKLLDEAKTPRLHGWADKFVSNDAVKNVIPEPQVYIEVLQKMQAEMEAKAKAA